MITLLCIILFMAAVYATYQTMKDKHREREKIKYFKNLK